MAKLYVGNLSYEVTDESLLSAFANQGVQAESARVIREMETGRSRGFGFVELKAGEEVGKAVAQMNGFNLEGRSLTVNEARPQTQRGGGGSRDGRGHGGGRRRY
jgi:RNA recognition motif-containing protein